jgi:flagellar biosynthesis regulator FlbT
MVELKTKLQQYIEKKYNVIESFKQRNIKVVSPNSYGVIQDNFKIIVSDLEPIIEEYTNARVLEVLKRIRDKIKNESETLNNHSNIKLGIECANFTIIKEIEQALLKEVKP